LREKVKEKRREFIKMILDKNIFGRNIYFTDEERFILNPPLNKTTNQIRLDNKGLEEYNSGKGKLFEKIANPVPKFPKGFMVTDGISYNGVDKLIFVLGQWNLSLINKHWNFIKKILKD